MEIEKQKTTKSDSNVIMFYLNFHNTIQINSVHSVFIFTCYKSCSTVFLSQGHHCPTMFSTRIVISDMDTAFQWSLGQFVCMVDLYAS